MARIAGKSVDCGPACDAPSLGAVGVHSSKGDDRDMRARRDGAKAQGAQHLPARVRAGHEDGREQYRIDARGVGGTHFGERVDGDEPKALRPRCQQTRASIGAVRAPAARLRDSPGQDHGMAVGPRRPGKLGEAGSPSRSVQVVVAVDEA